jgi:cullin 3
MPGSGLVVMLDNKQVSDLNRLYTLFAKVPASAGLDALKAGLRKTIAERGKMINQGVGPSTDEKGEPGMDVDETLEDAKGKGKVKPKEVGSGASALNAALRWVQEVLDLKDKFDTVLLDAFEDDKSIQTAINEVSSAT